MIDDDGGGWVQLDPQNREEWEAFWQRLLSQFEEVGAIAKIGGDNFSECAD